MRAVPALAVFGGAGLGALLRWGFGAWLDPVYPAIPLGTLAANLLGGLLAGAAVSFFTRHAALAPEWRLLVVTGFLGGLTTFSTFSAEVVDLIGRHEHALALAAAGAHLAGSLVLTAAGIVVGNALLARPQSGEAAKPRGREIVKS
ncbi:MAG: fluoride efflux transporter CrcB [Burkholderiales bacterium]|nr:fluoride efflux transporter CrcB [Burkholderiales bacterium]OJX05912.1 MAG: fluoride ion transporter CrcB [Burkholderiales bacterium 70-64]